MDNERYYNEGTGEAEAPYRDRAEEMGLYDDYTGRSKKKRRQDKHTKKGKNGGKNGNGGKKKSKGKTVLIVLLAFLVIAGCCFILLQGYIKDKLSKADHVAVSAEEWGIDPEVAKDLEGYKNLVLLGIDTRENSGEDPEHCRSDAIIIVTINEETKDVELTSVLRDSYLDLEEEGWHNVDKVTHAHAYGGPTNAVRALNRNMDLNIDDFIRVDWRAVKEVTDAMGGLEIDVDESVVNELNRIIIHTAKSLKEDDYKLVEHGGLQTLDGIQVTAYCRIRKTDGDVERAGRMREVILAAIEKAKKMRLSELNHVIDVGMSHITTSMDSKTMLNMLMDLTSYNIGDNNSWPYEYAGAMLGGVSYDVPVTLKSQVVALHEKLFGQENYEPTEGVQAINERVKYESNYYGGEELNYELLDRYNVLFGNYSE